MLLVAENSNILVGHPSETIIFYGNITGLLRGGEVEMLWKLNEHYLNERY